MILCHPPITSKKPLLVKEPNMTTQENKERRTLLMNPKLYKRQKMYSGRARFTNVNICLFPANKYIRKKTCNDPNSDFSDSRMTLLNDILQDTCPSSPFDTF